MYNVVMFAYNEADNIQASVKSVFENSDEQLAGFYLIANGCTDNTIEIAHATKASLGFDKMKIEEITLGDKCNAWNTYVHEISDDTDVHFFCDADVQFSPSCFSKMHDKLISAPPATVVVAGMPLAGRNIDFYRSLVIERSCFFGNLYGVRLSFIQRVRESMFKLPVGLNWIDSFLTKAVNTDLQFSKKNIPNRTTWVEGCGYEFDSLSLFKRDDIKLYVNRIARYELGKLQEVILDDTPVSKWPDNLHDINQTIWNEFEQRTSELGWIKTQLVKKRLRKMINKAARA